MRFSILLITAAVAVQLVLSHPYNQQVTQPMTRILTADGRAIDLSEFVSTIKGQIKEAVAELTAQASSYVLRTVDNFRIKLLRKLGPISLGNIFHWVFDGVPGLIAEEANFGYQGSTWGSNSGSQNFGSSNGHQNSPTWAVEATTKKYEEDFDLFSLLAQKAPGSVMMDEYSDDNEDDDNDDDDKPNDVKPDYSFLDFVKSFN